MKEDRIMEKRKNGKGEKIRMRKEKIWERIEYIRRNADINNLDYDLACFLRDTPLTTAQCQYIFDHMHGSLESKISDFANASNRTFVNKLAASLPDDEWALPEMFIVDSRQLTKSNYNRLFEQCLRYGSPQSGDFAHLLCSRNLTPAHVRKLYEASPGGFFPLADAMRRIAWSGNIEMIANTLRQCEKNLPNYAECPSKMFIDYMKEMEKSEKKEKAEMRKYGAILRKFEKEIAGRVPDDISDIHLSIHHHPHDGLWLAPDYKRRCETMIVRCSFRMGDVVDSVSDRITNEDGPYERTEAFRDIPATMAMDIKERSDHLFVLENRYSLRKLSKQIASEKTREKKAPER